MENSENDVCSGLRSQDFNYASLNNRQSTISEIV
jgi:hypothetical protein